MVDWIEKTPQFDSYTTLKRNEGKMFVFGCRKNISEMYVFFYSFSCLVSKGRELFFYIFL